MYKYALIFLLIVLIPGSGYAQLKSQTKPLDLGGLLRMPMSTYRGVSNLIGLDPSKLHVSQSYSLTYFSFGGQSFAQGLYLNTMDYQLSSPLSMRLQWGFAHAPLSNVGASSVLGSGPFVSQARLNYRPSDRLSIGIEFNTLPYYYQNLGNPTMRHEE